MLTIQRSFITKAQSSEEEEQLYQIVEQYMPYLAGLLYQLWHNQSKAITYRELKDMLSSGFVPPTLYTELIHIKTNILIFSLFPQMKAFAAGIWNTQRSS